MCSRHNIIACRVCRNSSGPGMADRFEITSHMVTACYCTCQLDPHHLSALPLASEDVPTIVNHLGPTLWCISKFDVTNTLPGLRHNFCALWNEITSLEKRTIVELLSSLIIFSDAFGIFISLYIKVPMVLRPPSMPPQMIVTSFCSSHPRIRYAISGVISMSPITVQQHNRR
jgi:hypothetical protein